MRYRFAWILITVLYLFFRFQNTPGVLTDHGVVLNDTDPYYRLHRIEHIVNENWIYPLKDFRLSYPKGFEVPWPLGLDYAFALPLKILGLTEKIDIEVFSSILIPLLSLPTLWLTVAITTQITNPIGGLVSGLMLSAFENHTYSSEIGRIDHHFLESLFTILCLYLLFLYRRPQKSRSWIWLSVLLGLSPSFWPQAWILGIFLALSLFCDTSQKESRKIEFFILIFASLISLLFLMLSNRFGQGFISYFGFSWISPLVFGWLGLMVGLSYLLSGNFKKIQWRYASSPILYVGAISVFVFAKNPPTFLFHQTQTALNALKSSSGTMSITTEAASIFSLPILDWLSFGILPLTLAWVCFIKLIFDRERWWLAGFCAIPLVLSLFQVRFIPLASPVIFLLCTLFFLELGKIFLKKPWAINLGMVIASMALIVPGKPSLNFTAVENVHPFYRPIRGAARFLDKRLNKDSQIRSHSAIISPWDYGHWFLYYAKLPVVAHPFQDQSSQEVMKLYLSEESNALDEFLKKHPARFLLVEAPTGRIARWFRVLGKDPLPYLEKKQSPETRELYFQGKPDFRRLFVSRFFHRDGRDEHGALPQDWKLIFVSPFASPDDPKSPALKIFEHTP